jgi:dTDP-4-dehydrorhamnose reductase
VRALIIGASGLVGGALLRHLAPDAVGTYRTRALPGLRRLDAADRVATRSLIGEVRPEVVFFPAADPNVDWCETHPDEARQANVLPAISALEAAREANAAFVFFSSDYVFDGRNGPYAEDASPGPLSVYGRQKLEVEERVLAEGGTVVRTTAVYGIEPPPGKNFVLRVVSSLSRAERVMAPFDQISTPTWSDDLASAAVRVATRAGVWNAAGRDLLARDAFARLAAEAFDLDASLIDAVPTERLRQRAPRPARGGLRTDKIARLAHVSFAPAQEALRRLRSQLDERAALRGA